MTPAHTAMVRNILSVYRLATSDEISRGLQWYPLAHAIVCEWASTFDRSIANVACIIAALSPQVSWTRNLVVADDILYGSAPSIGGGILSNVRKAQAIRDDNATDTIGYFKIGCKVRSFAINLAGNYDVVTVDTHGAQIASGDVCRTLRVDTWARYKPVARAYVDCAHTVKLAPAHLQAITWLTWKRLYPHKQTQRREF